ncbi:MAG: type II toxin-antitoxin system Phd/YefM family antitoxin [Thermotogaceae bacterium]|nr:type II toxin-antitoxin system Phd/YefM family antitoxin [Thermotogaceae bacterium]
MDIERIKFSSLADAKAKFSKIVEEARTKDVIVTKNGVPVVVIIDFEKYTKIMKFLDETRDLYLLDLGDVSSVKKVDIDFEGVEEV